MTRSAHDPLHPTTHTHAVDPMRLLGRWILYILGAAAWLLALVLLIRESGYMAVIRVLTR